MYTPPLRDIQFVLEHVVPLGSVTTMPAFAHASPDVVAALLEEAGRFSAQALAPTNRDGDREPARLEPDGEVRLPESFARAYDQFVAAGWAALGHPAEHGGGGFPNLVAIAVREMVTSANMALSLCPMLTAGAVCLLDRHASPAQRSAWLPALVSGRWSASMAITESQAGSDVGAITARAVPAEDGAYLVTGQKIFITFGEHGLTENILHLVLARLPEAAPGTRGLSLFAVPKFLIGPDGSLGERNDVCCVSVEHKVGIHGSPTCVLSFGEGGGAVGHLIGEPHTGIRQMFTMMNDARLGIGLQGLAIAERAYQRALAHARGRHQGVLPGSSEHVPIIRHPDVRRMLLTQKACIEAMRALLYENARALDLAIAAEDPDARARASLLADLLTPLSKAWATDLGVELTSLALQVHGGMGYVEETGVGQHWRDARIAPIYEGTNGIQALDLVGRKLRGEAGDFAHAFLEDARAEAAGMIGLPEGTGARVLSALDGLVRTTKWMQAASTDDAAAGATPYLRQFATVLGAWLLARGAAAAAALSPRDDAEAAFLRDKAVCARFYTEQILPQAEALAAAAVAGTRDLDVLDWVLAR